ncbi:hypothetical protein M3J09_001972 [Ascochyta lentis]
MGKSGATHLKRNSSGEDHDLANVSVPKKLSSVDIEAEALVKR